MEIAGFLLLAASIGLFLMEWFTDGPAALGRVRSIVVIPILGYVAMTATSAAVMLEHTEDQLSALRELKWVLYFFAFAYFFEKYFITSWERYLPAFTATVFLMGAFSIAQFIYGLEYPRSESVLDQWGEYFRVTGLFNLPQSFAGNMGMALFMLLGITLAQINSPAPNKVHPVRYRCAAASLLGAVGLILSLTRAAWVAGAVVGVLALARAKKVWGVMLLLAVLILAALGSGSQTIFGDRLSGDIDRNERSILHREALWEVNWGIVKDHPWLGVGPWQNLQDLPAYPSDITHAHNNVLQVLASQGVVSAMFYLGFCAYFFWAAYSLSSCETAHRLVRGLALGSLYSQIYFHLLGLVDSPFFDQEVKNMIVFIWALTFALHQRERRGTTLT